MLLRFLAYLFFAFTLFSVMRCNKCDTYYRTELLVMCGYCSCKFCSVCGNLSAEKIEQIQILAKENIFWACSDCYPSLKSSIQAINALSINLDKKIDALSTSLAEKLDLVGTVTDQQAAPIKRKTKKKKQTHIVVNAGDSVVQPLQPTALSLPPVSNTDEGSSKWNTVHRGRRQQKNIYGTLSSNSAICSVEALKWIYIGDVAVSTKVDDLVEFVANSLSIPNTRVAAYALLKKGASTEGKRFISFKVGVPVPFYDKVLCSDFWPIGVSIREFVFVDGKSKNH